MLTISVHTVDGGHSEWAESDAFYRKLLELRGQGHEGKALINSLLTDDWGAPPSAVRIHGTLEDGTKVNETLPYR